MFYLTDRRMIADIVIGVDSGGQPGHA